MNRASIVAMSVSDEEAAMVRLGELMMILELHRQGLSITHIARRTGRDPKTVRKYIERGIEVPVYGPRPLGRPGKLSPYLDFIRERVTLFPELSAARMTREIRALGYIGAYTAVKRHLGGDSSGSWPQAL
jgi:transposase